MRQTPQLSWSWPMKGTRFHRQARRLSSTLRTSSSFPLISLKKSASFCVDGVRARLVDEEASLGGARACLRRRYAAIASGRAFIGLRWSRCLRFWAVAARRNLLLWSVGAPEAQAGKAQDASEVGEQHPAKNLWRASETRSSTPILRVLFDGIPRHSRLLRVSQSDGRADVQRGRPLQSACQFR